MTQTVAEEETKQLNISTRHKKIIQSIPGYDPIATAEDCYFDNNACERALGFFPDMLTHIKGRKAGQPFVLELWEKAIIANLFGWKRPDGTRRYREAFIEVARKNGKTPLAAGIILYGLLCDGEMGAEIYSAAASRQQSGLIYDWVKGMSLKSPELQKRTKVYQHSVVEIDPETGIQTGNTYKPISADAFTKHGYNSHIVVVDELHAQPNRELVDVLETSTAARAQPLIISITTRDWDRDSICNEKEHYAEMVRDGVINNKGFLPVLYNNSLDADWTKKETWQIANPNMGVSISEDYIAGKCEQAKESPAFENTFKRLHCNIKTEQDSRFIAIKTWDANDKEITIEQVKDRPCFIGLDLSNNTDIAVNGRLFVLDDGYFAYFPRYYVPADNAPKREKKDKVPYQAWSRGGYITLTPGNVVDYATIKEDFKKDYEQLNVVEAAFDRWNFEAIRQNIIAEGVPEDKLIAFGQGYASMSVPTKELEKILLSKKLIHNGNPVSRWMAGNVTVDEDPAGNIKPSKSKSTEKIDGIVSLIMCIGRALTSDNQGKSVYEERGIYGIG